MWVSPVSPERGARSPSGSRRMRPEGGTSSSTRAPRVLIVEDEPAMALALRDGFEFEGFQVVVAEDGAEGLRLARQSDLDLVVLDVMLPRLSGLEICRQLRAAKSGVPILM